ncbi:gamma-aminobutyric acid receptor subunit beta-like [Vanessa tameamea]|uniref:Gamma-aminobutyric acid receptor subunit beta n=1 Tax=Vanessa tameamea TaxID=334116 RepID=A0A8B8IT34_VANTA|nr:gamma-aminobutyric acid receptor subunit beta-like [Vanessa tameamea]XP_047543438.1 gamma-aminobutyric acid receptor subunit beta-like [Vanessa atalanta]
MQSKRPRLIRSFALVVSLAIAWLPHADHAAGAGGGGMFGDVNISAILDSLSVSYDKRVRPNYGGPPVDVGVTMYVLSISSLSEVKMDFTLDFYFRQFWTDPRLAYKKRPGVETLSVGSEFIRNIWVPDTFFVNEKQSYFHIATTSNEFIRIHHSGSITRSIRLTITASCPMDLQYFPMDRQLCNIEIESFGYTMRDIRYKWNEGPNSVGVSSEVSLPQFKVLGHRQRAMEISLTTGNYSRLACEIQFVRSMGYYLIQIYIPSGLIVIISWVSFWLNRNATPARVSLGVTTVLTMTTLMSSTNAALPKISYVKSIDVYLGTCFVMVFASLLEYATVGYMAKRIQMRKQRFNAVQKMAAEKKTVQVEGAPGPSVPEPLPPPRNSTITRPAPPSRSSSYNPHTQEVRFKVHDAKVYTKTGPLESNGSRGGPSSAVPVAVTVPVSVPVPVTIPMPQTSATVTVPVAPAEEEIPAHLLQASKGINKLLGTTPSDIDKYSRIVFPVCFVCFNLMYWIIYLHVSDVVADDLVLLGGEN